MFFVPKISNYHKNLVKLDAGKHYNYSRQRINTARLSLCVYKTLVTSLSVCIHTLMPTSESRFTFHHVGK